MIEELTVRNYVLVENISINFDSNFVVMSGETGAGKSLLADALRLLFGVRADVSMIRDDADEAVVTGSFLMPSPQENAALHTWLDERGIVPDDGRLLVRRTIKRTGRSNVQVQSVPATLPELGSLASMLVDMHSQHEHQSLFSANQQLQILDRYAGIQQEVSNFEKEFLALADLKKQYETRTSEDFEHDLELKRHALREIEQTNMQVGEEEKLEQEIKRLSQFEQLSQALGDVEHNLSGYQNGVLHNLRSVIRSLDTAVSIDAALQKEATRIQESFYELEDINQELLSYKNKVVFDSERLQYCTERLRQINELERKYGKTIQDVLTYAQDSRKQIDSIEEEAQDIEQLAKDIANREKAILVKSNALSQKRKQAASELEPHIISILQTLGMPDVQFAIDVAMRKNSAGQASCGVRGSDAVRFLFSANPGQGLKALSSIASGGELSRVMLAIKSAFAASDNIPTLVFDEIDSGIGGEVGKKLAEHLLRLAKYRQVVCITHLASIAASAAKHLKIEKYVREGRSYIRVMQLAEHERVEEVSRMLAGDQQETLSREHAKFLLKRKEL